MSTAIQAAGQAQSITQSPMGILQLAVEGKASIDVIERVTALVKDERDYQAKVAFDDALNSCQQEIGRIVPNRTRENNIAWADYAHIDTTIRPVYLRHGLSVGFSEVLPSEPGRLGMCAEVSKGGVSKKYFASISRAAPNGKMNQSDADASAASRVKRYLMLDIFNIAVGIGHDESKPFDGLKVEVYAPLLEAIEGAASVPDVTAAYIKALKLAKTDAEKMAFENAAKKRKGELVK